MGFGINFSPLSVDGLKFPAVHIPDADPNTLDDYEEGTWTPADGSGAALSFTSVSGKYTKVGNIVTAVGALTYPATADGSNTLISGLPFAAASGDSSRSGYISFKNAAVPLTVFNNASASTVNIFKVSVPVTNVEMTLANILFTVIYSTV